MSKINKVDALKIANALFKNYPSVDIFHITSDGQAFESVNNANSHALSLDKNDLELFKISRDDIATAKANMIPKPMGVESSNSVADNNPKASPPKSTTKKL